MQGDDNMRMAKLGILIMVVVIAVFCDKGYYAWANNSSINELVEYGGIILICVGITCLVHQILEAVLSSKRKQRWRERGQKVLAVVVAVDTKERRALSGETAVVIMCKGIDVATKTIRTFKSQKLWFAFDGSDDLLYQAIQRLMQSGSAQNACVPVYVDAKKPQRYFVDVENFIIDQQMADAIIHSFIQASPSTQQEDSYSSLGSGAYSVFGSVVFLVAGFILVAVAGAFSNQSICTAVLKLSPNSGAVHYSRGLSYYDNMDYNQAIADFDKCIELGWDAEKVYYKRGSAYYQLGYNAQAISDYTKVIELNTDFEEVYEERGYLLDLVGEHERAVADLNVAIKLSPHKARPYYFLIASYIYSGTEEAADSAINVYEQFLTSVGDSAADNASRIQLKAMMAEMYFFRGLAEQKKEEYDKAIADYNMVIEMEPNAAEAYNNRGKVLTAIGEYEKAINDFETAIKLNPKEEQVYIELAHVYERLQRNDEVNQVYQKLSDIKK
ncbi:MAG: hypothetical protein H6Q73_11 [Firmicutes bacterium]|nr:hypothetical protein [Bacillota bacterium]